jgi:hypothetical protein
MQSISKAEVRCGSNAAEPVKPDGAVCPLLIRQRTHFCRAVIDVKGHKATSPDARSTLNWVAALSIEA